MSKRPMRVSFITSPADMAQTIASQCSRRACSAGSTGRKWSSMNSIVAMTMSPRAMSARQRSSAAASSPHSAAACTRRRRPGHRARQACGRRASAALARWLSIVTITTRIADAAWRRPASAAEVRFGIVERLDGDGGDAALAGEALGVAACLAAHEERDLAAAPSRRRRPRRRWRRAGAVGAAARPAAALDGCGAARPAAARRPSRPGARARRRRGTRSRRGTCASRCSSRPIISGCTQVSKMHVGALEAHLRRVARREVLHVHRRRDHRAGHAQALGDVALHLRAEHQLGLQLGDAWPRPRGSRR